MTPIPHFVAVGKDDAERVRRVVDPLAAKHPELQEGGDFLWSACGYLLADGQQLNDGRVLAEAKRRKARYDATMARNARKRERWAAEKAEAEAA